MHHKSTAHSHMPAADDEQLISKDLRSIRPFKKKAGNNI